MVIRNTGHIGSAVEFKINNHDPLNIHIILIIGSQQENQK